MSSIVLFKGTNSFSAPFLLYIYTSDTPAFISKSGEYILIVTLYCFCTTLTVTSDFSFPAVAIKSTECIPLPFFTQIVPSFNVTSSLKELSFNSYVTDSSLLFPSLLYNFNVLGSSKSLPATASIFFDSSPGTTNLLLPSVMASFAGSVIQLVPILYLYPYIPGFCLGTVTVNLSPTLFIGNPFVQSVPSTVPIRQTSSASLYSPVASKLKVTVRSSFTTGLCTFITGFTGALLVDSFHPSGACSVITVFPTVFPFSPVTHFSTLEPFAVNPILSVCFPLFLLLNIQWNSFSEFVLIVKLYQPSFAESFSTSAPGQLFA